MKNFEFATAGRILFGVGAVSQVADAAAGFGARALVVTFATTARAGTLLGDLAAKGIEYTLFPVAGEPTVEGTLEGVALARDFGAQFVIGVGGGSVLDSAKAIAALAANPGDPFDYLEVIGRALPLPNAPLPVIAIPTTAGTGSEVTRNAVLASPAHGVKVSVRSPLMLPRLAVVDPALTVGLPPAVTASTGLDALTQLIEPFTSIRATPITDAICREALPLVARALPLAYDDGSNIEARTEMAYGSLSGGLALANAGLGAVHGFAGPIGGMFDAPHGAVCAALLPAATRVNLRALRERTPQSPALARYAEAAQLCLANRDATADDLAAWIERLAANLQIPKLGAYGIDTSHIPDLVAKGAVASSMKANPIALTAAELTEILNASL